MRKNLLLTAVLCLSTIVLFNSGCKKEKGNYIIEGTITDNTLGQAMAGQSLTVYVQNAGASNYLVHSTITTDANGLYHIEIERDQLDKIKIEGAKENYFPVEFVIPVSTLTVDQTYTLNKGTTAKSWARMIFIHQTGDPNAVLQYTKNDGKQDCDECCPKTMQTLTGFVHDTVYCINDGNTNYSYNYLVLGSTGFNTKTCYTPALDTGEVILNY